jgi:hypothetical protein
MHPMTKRVEIAIDCGSNGLGDVSRAFRAGSAANRRLWRARGGARRL